MKLGGLAFAQGLKVNPVYHIFRELEGLALLVSCLCHDLDHRGTTNSFQMASNSVLAGLYSSEGSVMEVQFSVEFCYMHGS